MAYELYGCDTETTGLSFLDSDVIELSLYRLATDEQRTWFLRPLNSAMISADALRVNGHQMDDLLGRTQEGRERYLDPQKVIIEVENWLMEDGNMSSDRILVGQNLPGFDKPMLEQLWKKCGSAGTFPFSNKYAVDTMAIELALNIAQGIQAEGYSLRNLTKKYGVVNAKAHSALEDTRATVSVFRKQLGFLQSALALLPRDPP